MISFLHSSVGKEYACNARDLDQFLGQEDPLEKGKSTHSSILAWVAKSWDTTEQLSLHLIPLYIWGVVFVLVP